MADPWDVPASRVPGNQPLPKLGEFLEWVGKKVPVTAPLVGAALYSWDSAKLDEVKKKFVPRTAAGEMGCMKACYNVLGILYTEKVATGLRQEIYRRARQKAEAYARRHQDELKKKIEEARAANPKLTEAQARWNVIDQWTSPFNSADHLFELMRERDMAGEKVNSPNKDAEQAIRNMTGNAPGVYFYGMAVNDNHTVTLAVERAADGSQKMYWMDQNNPGLRTEIKTGQLGTTLQGVQGYRNSTNIYAYRPPSAAP